MSRQATVAKRIRALLADGKPRTSREIAAEIRGSDSKVGQFLRIMREPGETQEVRAVDKGGYKASVRYMLGKGKNVYVRPAPATAAQLAARSDEDLTDAELDAKYRSQARWWPPVDPVVLQSINAMVRMGART